MSVIHPALLGLGMLMPMFIGTQDLPSDPARLKELLYDRQNPRAQSSAALSLLQLHSADGDEIVRQGLKQTDSPDVFCALAAALKASRETAFVEELVAGLANSQAVIRQ